MHKFPKYRHKPITGMQFPKHHRPDLHIKINRALEGKSPQGFSSA